MPMEYAGDNYVISIQTDGRDTYPNNFKCWVHIYEKATARRYKRRGYGKFIGNFSPIWIWWKGKSIQLTELNIFYDS